MSSVATENSIWDEIKPLLTQLQPQTDEEQKLEKVLLVAKAKFKIGDIVAVQGTPYAGIIHGFNSRLGGFYSGVRYPVFVKMTESDDPRFADVVGSVFEYDVDQVAHLKQEYYKIDCGPKALENGALGPLDKLFDIATLINQPVLSGECYGDDYLRVPRNTGTRTALEELLTESKLIWAITDTLPPKIRAKVQSTSSIEAIYV